MKHILSWVALTVTCLFASTAVAQDSPSQSPLGLTGVWQICQSEPASDGSAPPQTGPFMKLFGKSGELTNLFINGRGGVSVVTATGSYAQTSDSTYTETLTYATFAPLIGRPNAMKFRLVNDKYLYLEFRVEGASNPNPLKETWVRVTPPSSNTGVRPAPMPERRADGVYIVPEVLPEFPGGMNEMMKFLAAHIKYPTEAMQQKKEGRVLVQFVVDAEGQITEPKILLSVHPEIDAEALRVVSIMPRWTPGRAKGQAVPVLYNIPIKFKLPTAPKTNPLVASASLSL